MTKASKRTRFLIIPSALGIAMIAYLEFSSLFPAPEAPYNVFPYIAGGWLLVGLLIVVVRPKIAARIGAGLALTTHSSDDASANQEYKDPQTELVQ